jgi:uncharacterized membrane protein YeaQ/YmgE (transglycosylase-associated protein family)
VFYYIWLFSAGLAGWAVGRIAGRDGLGTGSDVLLGLTGAFFVRWSFEKIDISLEQVYLILFSVWGAAAFPIAIRMGLRCANRAKLRSRLQRD